MKGTLAIRGTHIRWKPEGGNAWQLGKMPGKPKVNHYMGCMAQLMIYGTALAQETIEADRTKTESASSVVRKTYPVDFALLDEEVKNTLYIANIGDGIHEKVNLQITNSSTTQLLVQPAGEGVRHFELRFRPGTFIDNQIEEKGIAPWQYIRADQIPDGWKTSAAKLHPVNRTVSLFFTYTGSKALALDPGESLDFHLTYSSADGQKGGRGTQVLLAFDHIKYAGSPVIVKNHKSKQIDIVNQRGKKNLPLHVGFVGANTILNDADPEGGYEATSSSLRIRFFNTLMDGKLLFQTGKTSVDKASQTKLLITFDNVDDDRGLGTVDELAGIKVKTAGKWAVVNRIMQGKMPTFLIDDFQVESLAAGEALDLIMTDIRSSKPSGLSNLYIHYSNMPGYWDGELALQIEKTPIISRNIGGKKHVGIGTMPDEYYQFKVGGNMRVEPDQDDKVVFSVGSKDGEQSFMQVLHNGSLVVGGKDYPHSPLHIQGNDQAGGHLYFYNGTNYNKGWVLLKRGENFPSKNSLLFSYYNGKGWDESLYLHPDGNAAFQQRVEDKTGPIMPVGAIVMWSGTKSTIPKGWVLCDGGNGTPDLRDRFVVGAGKSYNAKSTGGANKVTLKQTEMPKHSHSGRTDNQSVINTGDNKNYQLMHPNTYNRKFDNGKYTGYDRGGRDAKTLGNSLKDPHNHSFKTSTSGGGNAHENRPPYFALCFIMKT